MPTNNNVINERMTEKQQQHCFETPNELIIADDSRPLTEKSMGDWRIYHHVHHDLLTDCLLDAEGEN